MAAKQQKRISFTVEVEPPYTWVGIFTFLGRAESGLALTSKPIELYDGGILHVGENGGMYMQTTKTGKSSGRGKSKSKVRKEEEDG